MQQQPNREETPLGKIIELAREEEGLGLRELARASGVSAGQISRILAGKTSQPSVETLVRLAGALERDVDALLVLAESPEAFSGARLDAARIRLLEAIESLPAVHRQALAADEQNLRFQIEEAERLENDIRHFEVQLVESRAASEATLTAHDDGISLRSPTWKEVGTTAQSESLEPEGQLRRLRAERDALDETFAAAVREAAARLFSDVRGRTSAPTSASSPAWHTQRRAATHQTNAPRLSVRPLSELLPDLQSPTRDTVDRQEPTTERELRHLLRVWEQLSPTRRRRVAEFIDDQHRLSLHEQLSQDAKEEPREER
jgi:transcriptional regulator with XRE-family HTH domain